METKNKWATEKIKRAIKRFPTKTVLVLGDLMIDQFVYGKVNRISPEAPVPVVSLEKKMIHPGGAANVVANVASLGGRVEAFGVFGDDALARELVSNLKQKKVNVSGIFFDGGRKSTIKTRVIAHAQQVVRYDEEDTHDISKNIAKKIFEKLSKALPRADVLLISDYAKGIIYKEFIHDVIALAKKHSVPVLVDPKPVNFMDFEGASVIKPNILEAATFLGFEKKDIKSPEFLCKALRDKVGISTVVVTAGEKGMFVLSGEKVTHIPSVAEDVYDVTGAGDSALSALALGLASGLDIVEAAYLGNIAGSIAVRHLGVATVDKKELLAFLSSK